MSKIVKDEIKQLKPSTTLAINEESSRLENAGKKIYKFGFGQSPFPVPDSIIAALKKNANKNTYLPIQGLGELRLVIANHINKNNKK
mgnify:FL=1